ncbi:MAG TPA: protein-glutamate O-methyltransferase CheR [Thermodesulfobacteriota bacterium]|nr:protein-glutamate O-methyltransferase CheR [Thermodesulfobacteriota bacterium]
MNINTSTAYEDSDSLSLQKLEQYELIEQEFSRWQQCIESKCGLYFDKSRISFLCTALLERINDLSLTGYDEYLRYLLYNNDAEREWKELYCRLVNCETSFFRHQPSFELLKEHIFPQVLESRKNDIFKLLTVWSVGCSSGQEAYSIALNALQSYDTDEYYTKIIGSDINLHLLKKARKGIYTKAEVKSLHPEYIERYLFPYNGSGTTYYKFRDEVKDLVSFNFINLVESNTYKVFPVDIIFCQNVLFYFSKNRRLEIVYRLCEYLGKGGSLILGPSDILPARINGMETEYINSNLVYRKL